MTDRPVSMENILLPYSYKGYSYIYHTSLKMSRAIFAYSCRDCSTDDWIRENSCMWPLLSQATAGTSFDLSTFTFSLHAAFCTALTVTLASSLQCCREGQPRWSSTAVSVESLQFFCSSVIEGPSCWTWRDIEASSKHTNVCHYVR